MLHLVHDHNPVEFLQLSSPLLQSEPSVHSFIVSVTERCIANGQLPFRMLRGVDSSGSTMIAALQTDANRCLTLSKAASAVGKIFAGVVADQIEKIPGVFGPQQSIDGFLGEWIAAKGCNSQLAARQRLFEMVQVIPPRACSGIFRAANEKDVDILFRWQKEFMAEAIPQDPVPSDEEAYRDIRACIEKRQYFMWEDKGRCVCYVGSKRETATERWIAPVYTPPELRGHGYASALVAAVSEEILRAGKRAMLFTDLANPTSNSIYQKIGYRPLADFCQYMFV